MAEKVKLEISTLTILKVFLVMGAIYFLYMIKDIITLLFIVLILTASFRPVISSWEKKIKRLPAVILLLLIAIAIISIVIYLIIPPVVSQIKQLVADFPDYVSRYDFLKSYSSSVKESARSVLNNMGNLTGSALSIAGSVFGGFVSFVSGTIMIVYLLLDDKSGHFLLNLVPANQHERVQILARKISGKVGDWFRGQLILCAIIGVMVWIGLMILGVPYALTLAVIAGILELIPTIGPIISGAIAALIALQVSPVVALLVVILFVFLHQLENSILVPKIMQKAVGLSPVVVILAVLIGAQILGITGAILAVPVAASIWVIIQEWPQIRETLGK